MFAVTLVKTKAGTVGQIVSTGLPIDKVIVWESEAFPVEEKDDKGVCPDETKARKAAEAKLHDALLAIFS